ncbi:MAG: guanylate kinase [Armatimonadetes bacterium]|nr:guanylate kinase [Armatimonadota bacterium]
MSGSGLVLVVAGPSGVGKSTLLNRLLKTDPRLKFSVSMTTREPRPDEVDGQAYCFVDGREFERAVSAGELLEHALVHGHRYGTPRRPVAEQQAAGFDICLDIDVQGARQVRDSGADAAFVLIVPPSMAVLEERLRKRHTESPEELARRLETARVELAQRDLFDYEVVNEQRGRAVAELRAILTAERCRIRS